MLGKSRLPPPPNLSTTCSCATFNSTRAAVATRASAGGARSEPGGGGFEDQRVHQRPGRFHGARSARDSGGMGERELVFLYLVGWGVLIVEGVFWRLLFGGGVLSFCVGVVISRNMPPPVRCVCVPGS